METKIGDQWKFPSTDFLEPPTVRVFDSTDVNKKSKIIEDTLKSFGIIVDVVSVKAGSSVTQYALNPIK